MRAGAMDAHDMKIKTRLTELLGIRYPIVQAGMSWA